MRRSGWLDSLVALWTMLAVVPAEAQDYSQMTPAQIVDRVDQMMRGDSSQGTVAMSVVTRRWKRDMTLEILSEGTEKALIRVVEPKKEAGTTTLKVGSDIWNYLPKIDRTIRIPSSMMMASWMGSHFTNDDLVKESRLVQDYEITIAYRGHREGVEVYEFQLVPHPEAPVVWGRILYQVRVQDLMPVWARYFGEDGELKRTASFSQYRRMGGRLVPAIMRMIPADKPGESTQLTYRDLAFDISIPERSFSLFSLRR